MKNFYYSEQLVKHKIWAEPFIACCVESVEALKMCYQVVVYQITSRSLPWKPQDGVKEIFQIIVAEIATENFKENICL